MKMGNQYFDGRAENARVINLRKENIMSRLGLLFLSILAVVMMNNSKGFAQVAGPPGGGGGQSTSEEFFVEGDEFDIGSVKMEIDPDTWVLAVAPDFGEISISDSGDLIYEAEEGAEADSFEILGFAYGIDTPISIVGTVIGGNIATEFSVEIADDDVTVDIVGWANLSETVVLPLSESGNFLIDSNESSATGTIISGQLSQDSTYAWIFDGFLYYAVSSTGDPDWPTPPSSIPGGPWEFHPDPNNTRGGTLRPVNPPAGQSQPTLTWSPPTTNAAEGNPNGYWKHADGLGNTQRYNPVGSPITAAEAHPGRPGKNIPKKTKTPRAGAAGSAQGIAKGLGKVVIILGGVHEILDAVGDAIEEEKTIIEAWWDNIKATPFSLPGGVNPYGPLGGGGGGVG